MCDRCWCLVSGVTVVLYLHRVSATGVSTPTSLGTLGPRPILPVLPGRRTILQSQRRWVSTSTTSCCWAITRQNPCCQHAKKSRPSQAALRTRGHIQNWTFNSMCRHRTTRQCPSWWWGTWVMSRWLHCFLTLKTLPTMPTMPSTMQWQHRSKKYRPTMRRRLEGRHYFKWLRFIVKGILRLGGSFDKSVTHIVMESLFDHPLLVLCLD